MTMKLEDYIITDKADITAFFQTLCELEPFSVLDVGMFLKRIGFVSKLISDPGLDRLTRVDGVDFGREYDLPVYKALYETIYDGNVFFDKAGMNKKYEYASAVRLSDLVSYEQENRIMWWLSRHSRFALTDAGTPSRCKFLESFGTLQTFEVRGKTYGFLVFG